MPNNESDRSFVSGFVKRPRTSGATMFFTIARQSFVLPVASSYAQAVNEARQRRETLLILYEKSGKKHPRITGVVRRPIWKQIKAAEEGASVSTIENLVDQFVEVTEGRYA